MSKEAMKLALEALQVSVSCTDMYYVPLGKSMIPEVEEAIKVLEEALAKQEQRSDSEQLGEPVQVDVENVISALVKEEMRYYHDGHYIDSSDAKYQLLSFAHRVSKATKKEQQEQGEPVAKLFGTLPVYDTAPQQRTWVGLTDDEMNDIWSDQKRSGESITRAIEAKLKQKNGYAEEKNT